MRIALFGGTFDPVHTGHLLIAQAARETYHLDRVIFVPAGRPPHKNRPLASARQRLAMCRLAVRGNPGFAVSDWEIRQKRIVYTYETLEEFRRRRPRAELFFIIGSDSLKDLPRWKEAGRLRSLCRFLVMDRLSPFASTAIRRRLRRGFSCRYLVPDTVERYIRTRRLYRRPE
jgi:nicotinate-nucleotide adenylyltransferase